MLASLIGLLLMIIANGLFSAPLRSAANRNGALACRRCCRDRSGAGSGGCGRARRCRGISGCNAQRLLPERPRPSRRDLRELAGDGGHDPRAFDLAGPVLLSLRERRLRRGVFHSIVDLQAAINRFLHEHNAEPSPFAWTADPDSIIAAVKIAAYSSLVTLADAGSYESAKNALFQSLREEQGMAEWIANHLPDVTLRYVQFREFGAQADH